MRYFDDRQMKQVAVYWQMDSTNEFGEATFLAPVEIKCQWNDMAVEIVDWKGNHTTSKSQVMVDRDMLPGSYLLLGKLVDVLTPDLPREVHGIDRILRFDRVPRVRGDKFMRVAYL